MRYVTEAKMIIDMTAVMIMIVLVINSDEDIDIHNNDNCILKVCVWVCVCVCVHACMHVCVFFYCCLEILDVLPMQHG